MATIKAIEGRSVHQIQSGQVIVDLVSVVKELVENSLDAGATSIEIRFKDHGLESIEVQDNGNGIAPEDFETIALKHYTSKLSSYEDLTSLETFGFRGEALSSLCALSNFHIVTARTQDGAVGKKLEFENSGQLKTTSVTAAQRGTTVSVENLFKNLPVRRKELEKNVKREYGKAISHLYAYGCISVGVRFAVSNQMSKGKRVSVFSTKSNTTTRENLTNVFGTKTLLALVNLNLHLEMEPSRGPSTQGARNWSTQALDHSMQVSVQGHISKPVFGEGRQAPDRQMFFVNSRPCTLPQVAKAFNEVYKSFNVSQSPFIFANLIMDTNAYDVNVSPDKRTIMLHDQAALLESLKSSLTELFEKTDHTVPQSQLPNRNLPGFKPLTIARQNTLDDSEQRNGAESHHESESSDEEQSHAHDVDNRARNHVDGCKTPTNVLRDWVERGTEMRRKEQTTEKRSNGTSLVKQPTTPHFTTARSLQDDVMESRYSQEYDDVDGLSENDHMAPLRAEFENKSPSSKQIRNESDHSQKLDPMGSPYDDLFSQRPCDLPRAVQDLNALVDRAHQSHEKQHDESSSPEEASRSTTGVIAEQTITAMSTSSQKSSPGPVQNAFDRMRPKRTPLQTAEITVGDQTTTAVIGTSSFKKRRIHQPVNTQSIAQFAGSPLLTRGLRNFAAPDSQLAMDSSHIHDADPRSPESSDDESDKSSTEQHANAPNEENIDGLKVASRSQHRPPSSDIPASDPLDELSPAAADDDDFDDEYVDENEKKLREEEKVNELIRKAALSAAQPTEENLKRASQVLSNTGNRKQSTLRLTQYLETSTEQIQTRLTSLKTRRDIPPNGHPDAANGNTVVKDEMDDATAESRLSLTVSKGDFERMIVVGQFNLGFILAIRPASGDDDEDELFIIDQHAADEKYNYERLQRTVTLQNQRLVRPKPLELTAVEEEVILNNSTALKANGFEIETTSFVTDDDSASRRCRLLTLPMSREKTFELSDLEELLHLLSESPSGGSEIPRPKKVQSMLAMRACRSSIMVGRTLTLKQMLKVVKHMGEMEKPWNCPHGRPTMRHLAGLGAWTAWREGDAVSASDERATVAHVGRETDWRRFLMHEKGSTV